MRTQVQTAVVVTGEDKMGVVWSCFRPLKVILEFTVKQKRTLLLLSLFFNDQSGLSALSPVLVLFNVKLTCWLRETQGTFLSVLFVSCGFIEGAHLLRCSFGRTRSKETALRSRIFPLQTPLCLITLTCVDRSHSSANLGSSGEDLSTCLVSIHLHNTRNLVFVFLFAQSWCF